MLSGSTLLRTPSRIPPPVDLCIYIYSPCPYHCSSCTSSWTRSLCPKETAVHARTHLAICLKRWKGKTDETSHCPWPAAALRNVLSSFDSFYRLSGAASCTVRHHLGIARSAPLGYFATQRSGGGGPVMW